MRFVEVVKDRRFSRTEQKLYKKHEDTYYVNVVVKIGDGKTPHPTVTSKYITSDNMGIYVGTQKLFRSYYSNRTLTISAPHNSDYQVGDVVLFCIGDPNIDTYWQIISRSINSGENNLMDDITLANKRSEKR